MSVNLSQIHNRILVEVENENDNRPNFLQETIQPFTIHEVKYEPFQAPSQKSRKTEGNWENQDQYTTDLSSGVTEK